MPRVSRKRSRDGFFKKIKADAAWANSSRDLVPAAGSGLQKKMKADVASDQLPPALSSDDLDEVRRRRKELIRNSQKRDRDHNVCLHFFTEKLGNTGIFATKPSLLFSVDCDGGPIPEIQKARALMAGRKAAWYGGKETHEDWKRHAKGTSHSSYICDILLPYVFEVMCKNAPLHEILLHESATL